MLLLPQELLLIDPGSMLPLLQKQVADYSREYERDDDGRDGRENLALLTLVQRSSLRRILEGLAHSVNLADHFKPRDRY